MRRASHVLACLLLATAALAANARTPLPSLSHGLRELAPRPPAPRLRLSDMDGRAHDLARYAGRVVVVNFWATWCPPCRREMPSLERLRQKLKDRPFAVLAVNVGETQDSIFPFLGTLDMFPSYPILLDHDGAALADWPVKGLPTTYVVDKRGRLAYRAIGGREFDHPDVVTAIERLLSER